MKGIWLIAEKFDGIERELWSKLESFLLQLTGPETLELLLSGSLSVDESTNKLELKLKDFNRDNGTTTVEVRGYLETIPVAGEVFCKVK